MFFVVYISYDLDVLIDWIYLVLEIQRMYSKGSIEINLENRSFGIIVQREGGVKFWGVIEEIEKIQRGNEEKGLVGQIFSKRY